MSPYTFSFDAESRPSGFSSANGNQFGSASYAYDGAGRRVMKTLGSAVTVYVYDAFGTLSAEYGNTPTVPPCSTCYLIADTLGSIRAVTDPVGNVVSRHDFLPFGEELVSSTLRTPALGYGTADDVRQRFTGKERDAESGLDYFGARYYGSNMGRFMSPDPLGWLGWQHGNEEEQKKFEGFLGDPQHLNQYAYVLNNPLKFTDPDGLLEYLAKLLGKDVKVHIDDNLSDKQQNSLKGRLDAAIKNINDHSGSLSGEQKSVLGNIKSIDVDGSLKRSFVNESGGDFHLTTDYVKQGSTAWLGSAIGHDGYHVEEFKMGGYGASRGTNAEKGAFQFQLGLGQKIGFNSTETDYLKNLIAHPESLSGYYNSPVK